MVQEEFEAITKQVQSVFEAKGKANAGRVEDVGPSALQRDHADPEEAHWASPAGAESHMLGSVNQVDTRGTTGY